MTSMSYSYLQFVCSSRGEDKPKDMFSPGHGETSILLASPDRKRGESVTSPSGKSVGSVVSVDAWWRMQGKSWLARAWVVFVCPFRILQGVLLGPGAATRSSWNKIYAVLCPIVAYSAAVVFQILCNRFIVIHDLSTNRDSVTSLSCRLVYFLRASMVSSPCGLFHCVLESRVRCWFTSQVTLIGDLHMHGFAVSMFVLFNNSSVCF